MVSTDIGMGSHVAGGVLMAMNKVAVFHELIRDIDISIDRWAMEQRANILQINTVQDHSDERYVIITVLYEIIRE